MKLLMKAKMFCTLFFILAMVSPVFAGTDDTEALVSAAYDGDISRVQSLLSSGADVNTQRKTDSVTALMMAAYNGHVDIVKTLLESKADVNIQKIDGVTALWIAAQDGHSDFRRVRNSTNRMEPSLMLSKQVIYEVYF